MRTIATSHIIAVDALFGMFKMRAIGVRATNGESPPIRISEIIPLNTIAMRWQSDSVRNDITYEKIALDGAIDVRLSPSKPSNLNLHLILI